MSKTSRRSLTTSNVPTKEGTAFFRSGGFLVRRLQGSDVKLMAYWLSDPRLTEFYGGRNQNYDDAWVKDNYLVDEANYITPCMVEYEGRPLGFMQFYPLEREARTEYGYSQSELIFAIDLFIGEPDQWNKGLGSRLVRAMAEYLILHREAKSVVIDPESWNGRAISSYEKAGFVKVKYLPRHEMHEGELRDAWLMEFRGPSIPSVHP